MDQYQNPELTADEAEGVSMEEYFPNDVQLALPSPAESLIPRELAPPTQLRLNERLVWCVGVYCASFVDSTSAFSPREPPPC